MAIKQLIGPSFIGSSNIKFIVTRGLNFPVGQTGTGSYKFKGESMSTPKLTTESLENPKFTGEDMTVPKFITESFIGG